MDVTIFHQRAEQWRQQLLAVAGDRGNGASGDKVGGIFQNPGEFIDKLQQVAIHRGEGFFPIAQVRLVRFVGVTGPPINCLTF